MKKNFSPEFSFGIRLKTKFFLLARLIHTLIFNPSLIRQYKLVKDASPEIKAKKKAMKKITSAKYIESLMK